MGLEWVGPGWTWQSGMGSMIRVFDVMIRDNLRYDKRSKLDIWISIVFSWLNLAVAKACRRRRAGGVHRRSSKRATYSKINSKNIMLV